MIDCCEGPRFNGLLYMFECHADTSLRSAVFGLFEKLLGVCGFCLHFLRVQWAGLEPRRYIGSDLVCLRSTNACRHLVDVSVSNYLVFVELASVAEEDDGDAAVGLG